MLAEGAMVTYKESSRKLDGSCGIIEGTVADQPRMVLVRWVGEIATSEENADELELI